MQLTRFTDYCLRALMYLSFRDGELVTVRDISQAFGISNNHLMKVVSHLAAAGFVQTVRGKGGGLRLSRPPKLINLAEVVRECEPTLDVVECMESVVDSDCPLLPACVLRVALKDATRHFLGALERYTLHDLVENRTVGARLLAPPARDRRAAS